MKKKILGLLLGLIMATPAFASVGVSPTRIEINANKLKTNFATATINVRGDQTTPMRFRVYSEYFTINDKNELDIVGKSSDQYSLTSRLKYVPSEFTVLPNKTQKVRINIPNIKSLPNGESRVILMIEDVNAKEYNIPTGQAGIGAQLIVKSRVAVPIYVDSGKYIRAGEIEALNVKKQNGKLLTEMKLKSVGDTRFRYTTVMQVAQGKKLIHEYPIGEHAIGKDRTFVQKNELDLSEIKESGEFTLRAVVTYTDPDGKKVSIKKETNFNI